MNLRFLVLNGFDLSLSLVTKNSYRYGVLSSPFPILRVEEVNLSFDFGDSGLGFGPTLEIKGMYDHPQGI